MICKPGGNIYDYGIIAIPKPKVSPPIAVSNGCSGIIYESGFVKSTVKWTSVPFNATYNGYMSSHDGRSRRVGDRAHDLTIDGRGLSKSGAGKRRQQEYCANEIILHTDPDPLQLV